MSLSILDVDDGDDDRHAAVVDEDARDEASSRKDLLVYACLPLHDDHLSGDEGSLDSSYC